jgi:hypothetical protein
VAAQICRAAVLYAWCSKARVVVSRGAPWPRHCQKLSVKNISIL